MKKHEAIDHGKPYNWGNASKDYANFRDIYPENLFDKLHALDIGKSGQLIVDLGTGTGILPRYLNKYGASFIGVDISKEQIEQAKRLSEGNNKMEWINAPAENTGLSSAIADVVMACQCFIYLDKEKVIPEILRIMKPSGIFVRISMIWLPYEDDIVKKTEDMILNYNPDWTGAKFQRIHLQVPEWSKDCFEPVMLYIYDTDIPFTQESWRGRIRACRGMGASSLSDDKKRQFDNELKVYLVENQPEKFTVLHQILIEVYKQKI